MPRRNKKLNTALVAILENSKTPVADAWIIFRDRAALWDHYAKNGKVAPVEVVRDVFAAASTVLRVYVAKSPQFGERFPRQLAALIAHQIEYIVAGKLPYPIDVCTGRGRPGVGPRENRNIAIAVVYIKAVRAGLIDDPAPVAMVCGLYGVRDRAVRKWQRSREDSVSIADFFPGITGSELADQITTAMERAAAVYRTSGRGLSGKQQAYPRMMKQRP